MRVRKILIRIFPLFIISGIAIAVFYSLSSPVNINYSRTDSVLEDQNVYFVDIDNDSVVETITFFLYKNIQQPTIKVFSKQEFRNYWIFTDEKVNDFEIIFSDYDKDGIKEIFAFIQSNDSVFVYGMDIRDKYGFFLERKFVCKVQKYFDKFDFKIYALGSDDSDNDGIDEVYFIIDAKYFKQPRKVFKLNLANNKIEYSNKCGVRLLPSSKMYNIDNNVHKEILMSTFAAANYPDSVDIQYKDNQSWLVVLNSELENVFEPIPFKGAPSTIVSFPYNYKNKLSIGVLYRNTEDSENKLLVYNNKGEQIAKKDLSEIVCNLPIGNLSNDVIAFYNTNNLSIFDKDLKIIRKRNFNRNNLLTIFTKDINFDSKNEFVSIFNDKMIIFNDKLKKICENKIPENVKIIRVSLKKCDKTQLILHTHKSLIYFDITNNYIYKYRWIIYILIVLIIVLLYILYLRRKKNNSFNFRKDKFYDAKVNEIYGSTKFENKVNGKLSVVSEIFKKIESRVGINDRQNALLKHHDSFIKVKKYFDKISLSEYYKKDFVDLIEQFIIECSIDASYIIDFNIFPKKEFIYFNNNVKIEILIIISEIFNQINKSDCDKIFLQVIKNNSYVNLFCEVSCEGKTFIEKNQKDLKILKNTIASLKGKIDIDNSIDKVIFNIEIGLDNFEYQETLKKDERINIAIAEDHEVTVFGLKTMLKNYDDINFVGSGSNGIELLELIKSKKVDVIITDIAMPEMNGIELSKIIKNEYPEIKIVVFTMYLEYWFFDKLKDNGVKGYVSKNSKIVDLVYAIRKAYRNEFYYCNLFKEKINLNALEKVDINDLSENEITILRMFEKYKDVKEMSTYLLMSEKSVNKYLSNIIIKLNVSNRNNLYTLIEESDIF